jgi:hypothetical protein
MNDTLITALIMTESVSKIFGTLITQILKSAKSYSLCVIRVLLRFLDMGYLKKMINF